VGAPQACECSYGLETRPCCGSSFCAGYLEVPTALKADDINLQQQANNRLAWRLALVALLFTGFGFAMVPLYDVICRVTGLNGKTNAVAEAVDANTQIDATRWVKVEFLSHTLPGSGLEFSPEQFSMQVHPGEVIHTTYVVKNRTQHTFVGQAVPSVTPAVAAPYFQKIECFCFSQQTLAAGEKRAMPVVFVVKPDMDREVGVVTLSYTFYEVPA